MDLDLHQATQPLLRHIVKHSRVYHLHVE